MDFKERSNWVAIIGSREASDEELEAAYKLGKICAKKGKIVVSGLAKGIDRAGHEGAIDGGGLTIALVSTPIFMPIYPHENKDLAEKIKNMAALFIRLIQSLNGLRKVLRIHRKGLLKEVF